MNVDKYKKTLLKEKDKLNNLVSHMQDNTLFGNTNKHTSEKYTSGELSSYDNHLADIGTEVYMQDMQNSLTSHEQGKILEIDNALYKIDNGTYGVCEKCHNQISEDRLDILPETSYCSLCAKEEGNKHIASRNNQNLINKGSSFYDDVLLDLIEPDETPHNKF